MSVYSMTGYASAQADIGQSAATATDTSGNNSPQNQVQLAVEIRSVNSRFLDISFRLPDELRQTEPALRALLTANIKRGKVELRVALENATSNLPTQPSIDMLAHLKTVQSKIQSVLPDARG